METRRPTAPASVKPEPSKWSDAQVTLAWIGHSTVLINFFGVTILTDPVLFSRVGIRLPGFTIGPKRLTAPALSFDELPKVDLVLLSHAHFDHLDLRTLRCFDESTSVITARATRDLLQGTRFSHVRELDWGQSKGLSTATGEIEITAFPVKHWGARTQRDTYRGYNGYMIERSGRRIIFAGDAAMTKIFAERRRHSAIDVAIMSIGAYNPWIQSHCTPEQAVRMANAAGARFIVPVHHQTLPAWL
jgi:L-ascorbate metabolism protein UlaG (beta-lactamase superfamily)